MSIPDMPRPPEADVGRMQTTSLAERLLLGNPYEDIKLELAQFLADEVLDRMTHPDITRNPLKSYARQSNVIYSERPQVDANGADLSPILRPELWPLRQRGHLITLGIRDSFIRLDWYAGQGVSYRVVAPSFVTEAWADARRPDVPVGLRELRLRRHEGKVVWTRDTWDVSDPTKPVFKIEVPGAELGGWVDVTGTHMPELPAGGYPYVRKGVPIFPWVMYHPEVTDKLWHWDERLELIDGTLKVCCLWTMWVHGVRDCAHPQRVGLDVEAPQAKTADGAITPMDRLPLDQSAILLLRSAGQRNGSITTLAPGMDPKAMAEAILSYEAGLAQSAGLSAADVQAGGTSGMSGYAIVVSRDGQRRQWAAQRPAAEMGDRLLLATAAKLSNAYGSTALPEEAEAYTITYAEVGRSADEVLAELAELEKLVAADFIGPIDAIRRIHPSLDTVGAVKKIGDIYTQKAIVARIKAENMPTMPVVLPPAAPAADPTPTGA